MKNFSLTILISAVLAVGLNVSGEPAKCPPESDPENIVFIPSDEYCDKYYICFNGTLFEFRCAQGLHFNPVLNICDFPRYANCKIEKGTISFAPGPLVMNVF
ncbi:Peritrophin-1 [Pseudolycoriella hygida]|uniref:Peritrophin-1 n=1 Tax=Pseudolycoriella hygida TaxID=35572 RepID=A0A9Q0MSR8_9DIPT|nr:Peritrophin-1 [Pseudolycoriella hygida]